MKQSHWVPTLLFPLYLKASHHFATWPKVDQIDWHHLSLIVDTEVWLQDDPTGHNYTLLIPNFFLDIPFWFSVHRDTFFAQASFSDF